MNKFLTGLVILVFLVTGIAVLKQCEINDPIDDPKVQAEFKRRDMEYEKELASHDSTRKVAELRFDSLATRFDSLARINKTLDSALVLIPGEFKNLNSKQLQDRMIEEFNKRPR